MSEMERSSSGSVLRGLVGGVVGALVPFAAWGVVFVTDKSGLGEAICPSGGLECLPPMVLIGLLGGSAAAWPMLALAGVRPGWSVALLGLGINVVLLTVTLMVTSGGFFEYLLIVGSAIAYASAALIIKPRGRRPVSLPHS